MNDRKVFEHKNVFEQKSPFKNKNDTKHVFALKILLLYYFWQNFPSSGLISH